MAIESMEETMTSPLRSPLHDVEDPALNSDAIVHRQEETGDPPPFLPGTPETEAKAAVKSSSKSNAATQSENSRAVTWILRNRWRAKAVRRASLAARVAAAMFCLLSFSVMAADKGRGWASDSFNRYKEYRYCVSVNVIGFVYAGFQAYSEVNRRIGDEEIIRRPLGDYFDFAMDQLLIPDTGVPTGLCIIIGEFQRRILGEKLGERSVSEDDLRLGGGVFLSFPFIRTQFAHFCIQALQPRNLNDWGCNIMPVFTRLCKRI
ncbi:CASP-like protein [Platanthera zijinensis]|uniref:CASP-like protein n=1 Tax=Platanthera zijinensis TaxID=2320716 RepID=A0AAP0G5H1_9ASPA